MSKKEVPVWALIDGALIDGDKPVVWTKRASLWWKTQNWKKYSD